MRTWLCLAVVVGTGVVACDDSDAIAPASGGQAGQSGHAGQSASGAGEGGSDDGATAGAGAGAFAEAGTGGSSDDSIDDTAGEGGASGAGPGVADDEIISIAVSPLDLVPAFSSSITDYYVRCDAGANQLTLTTTSASGTSTRNVTLAPDEQTSVADKYFIRCLPPDFPVITVTKNGAPTPGYYLSNSANYAMVLDAQGVPVWYARGTSTLDLDSPAPNTLSFMPNFDDVAASNFEVRDLDANTVTLVTGAAGTPADGHELQFLPNGHRLILTTPVVSGVDLTGLKTFGANQNVLSCNIEELDAAGNLVFSWQASDHIDPVQESLVPAQSAAYIDVYHCNSIDADAGGNLLLSVRFANALYYIDRSTGQVTWKLGGSAYSKDGAALIHVEGDAQTTFNLQHDARFRPNGNVSLFDDHGVAPGVARGIEYAINHTTGVATPVFQFLGSAASTREGGFRRYDDGESVICWGNVPTDFRFLTEIDAAGNDVFDLSFSDSTNVAYRAIKVPLSQFDIAKLRANTAK